MATVMVRFDPADANAEPPRLGSLTSRLKVATFFASAPRTTVPTKALLMYDIAQAVHVETLSLSQRCMQSAQWQKYDPTTQGYSDLVMRRDSTMSMTSPATSIPEPTSTWTSGKPFYTAKLLVPISLPKNKAFIPTFHSCLVSRIYILDLSLSIPALGSAGVGSSIQLKVPVQLSSAGADDATASTDEATALAEQDAHASADDFFVPRSIAPPSPEYEPRRFSDNPRWATGRQYGLIRSASISDAPPSRTNQPSTAPPDYSLTAPQGSVSFPLPAFG